MISGGRSIWSIEVEELLFYFSGSLNPIPAGGALTHVLHLFLGYVSSQDPYHDCGRKAFFGWTK